MSNLSGNILTLGSTSLEEKYIKEIHKQFYVPNNCTAGTTVILEGIECVCVATDVTIQGSKLRRIAVDKNHDLGYYQKYVGMTQNGIKISEIKEWRWGGYGTTLGNTSIEVGYGLQNTINCLANPVCYTKGTYTGTNEDGYPWLWQGVNDFRSSHSDKWFLPSQDELKNYVYPYKDMLIFDITTGGKSTDFFWSSSEYSDTHGRSVYFYKGAWNGIPKYGSCAVRLCRAF